MNYWESSAWVIILFGWLAVLAFSKDRVSAGLVAFWLIAYNTVPIALDHLDYFSNTPAWGFTINGLIASMLSGFVCRHGNVWLFFLLIAVCVAHFVFAVMATAMTRAAPDSVFFITTYTLEALVVLAAMGLRFDRSGDFRDSGNLGSGLHDTWSGR